MTRFPTSSQQARDQAVRVRAHSGRLRKQLAHVAEQVTEVEEQCAAIHDALAAHAHPVVGAAKRAERARRFAAVERATVQAYRRGGVPPAVAWGDASPGRSEVGAEPRLRPPGG